MTIFNNIIKKAAATVTMTGAIGVGVLGLGVSPAGATLSMGTTHTGFMQGNVVCYPQSHQINIDYSVTPELIDYSSLDSITPDLRATPEWVDVYAYVKPTTSSTWGTPVAHVTRYVDHQQSVLNVTLRGVTGVRYNVAYVVRAAYPGMAWTNNLVDLPTSYSQSVPVYWQGIFMWTSTTYQTGQCMT